MAYYFMVKTKKGKYQELNISNSKYFQDKTRKFKKPCAYTLEEIDRFTIMFNNEIELRERLVQEGVLSLELFSQPLSIRYSIKGEYTKVPYDFLYQEDIEYIMDPSKLIEYIMKRYYNNDFMLIKNIASAFNNFRRCSSTAPEVRQFIEMSIRNGERHQYLDTVDENGDKLVARLIKLIILENYDEYKSGKVIYKDKVNYRNLHVLIALIRHHDKKQVEQKVTFVSKAETQPPVQSTSLSEKREEEKEKELTPKHTNPKKRSRKKKYDLEGQTTFDI